MDETASKAQNTFSVTKNLVTLIPFFWKNKTIKRHWSIVLTLFLIFATIGLNLSVPIIFKVIVNSLAKLTNEQYQITLILLISYGILWTTGRLFEKLREMVFFRPVSSVITDYSLAVFKHIHSLSLKFHLGRETGKVAGAIQRAQLAIAMFVTHLLFRILPVFIEALLAFLIMWHFVGIDIGLIVMVILITYLLMNYFIINIFKKAETTYQKIDTTVDKQVVDSLLNCENIKFLGAEDFESSKANKLLRKREDSIVNVFWAGTFMTIFQSFVLGIGLTIISYMVGAQVLSGQLHVGDFVLVNGYLLLLFNPLESVSGFIRSTLSRSAQIEHSRSLLGETHKIQDIENAPNLNISDAEIEFNHVSFRYEEEHRTILNNISFTIPKQATVAFVGPSGSGKSTLSRLLFRFYDVTAGSIKIDDQDIRHVNKNSLRKHIAAVPQDIVLLNMSLKYNITYGNFDVSDSEIDDVIRAVHLDQLITKLPNGLETVVGERGIKLSGGEKQRIAIARALLKQPKIMIFDEATSSLDTKTEMLVQKNIEEVTQNITTILIAHRLSTVIHADKIIVLDKGNIVEKGTHQELLRRNGLYSKLWGEQHEKE